MSDMRKVCALRLKMGKYDSRDAFYNFLKNVVGLSEDKFKEISYESKWIPDEKRFEDTNIVEYFELKDYSYVVDYETNAYYIDKRLFEGSSDVDMTVTISFDDMMRYSNELHKTFKNNNEIKIVAYDWYTGCDEPAYF